jgi:hypothetical protein
VDRDKQGEIERRRREEQRARKERTEGVQIYRKWWIQTQKMWYE